MRNRFIPVLDIVVLTHEYNSWQKHKAETDLRFGQYIVNKYMAPNNSMPEIYYEKDAGKAFELIYNDIKRGN